MNRSALFTSVLCCLMAACGGFRVSEGASELVPGAAASVNPALQPSAEHSTRLPSTVAAPADPAALQAAADKEATAIAMALKQIGSAKTDYRISSTDLIAITVYQDLDMNRKVRVNANGSISMPLIGAVKVGGMTLLEAQTVIEAKLAKFLVSPQVSLLIEEYGNKTVFVMGEVQKPGSYAIPIESRMTVLEAISTAGGFTPIAGQDRTRVLRNVNGVSVTYTIEVKAITLQGQKEKDLVLEPNDVIYVPQSFF